MSISIWEGNKAQALIDAITNTQKVDKQQGTINAGKALVVGEDGLVGTDERIPNSVKTALLKCFRHVSWSDPYGDTYYDELEAALNGVVVYPKIKVFRGKGVDWQTETVVDNETRMLSEAIPFTNTVPINIQWTDIGNDYAYSVKAVRANGVNLATVAIANLDNVVNSGWARTDDVYTIGKWQNNQFSPSTVEDTNGKLRVMIANTDTNADLPEDAPVGYIAICGTVYQIEVHDSEDFV